MGETIARWRMLRCLSSTLISELQVLCSFTGIGVVTVNDETAESYIKTANH